MATQPHPASVQFHVAGLTGIILELIKKTAVNLNKYLDKMIILAP